MMQILEKYEKRESYYQDAGRFLPLAVWGKKGYDEQRILDHAPPEDIHEHPVLGTTYRIRIYEAGTRGAQGWQQSDKKEASAPKKRKAEPKAEEPKVKEEPKAEEPQEAEAPPTNSSASSS